MPLLKLIAPGYRRRLAPYRPALPLPPTVVTELAQDLPLIEPALADEPRWRGFRSQSYRFESPFQGGPAHNRQVVGRLLHAGHESPWVLVVPGYATGATPPYNYGLFQEKQGWALLQRGISVALIDPPYHLSRQEAGRLSGEGFFSPDLQATQEAVLQASLDVVALARWLVSQMAQPLALWGTSMGGCVAGLAAAQLPELAGLALMEPLDNAGDSLATLPGSREIRAVLKAAGVECSRLHEHFAPVAPSCYRPAVAPDRILFATADWDRVVHASFQEAFWERWGRPERIRRPAGHILLAASWEVTGLVADRLAGWLRPASSSPRP